MKNEATEGHVGAEGTAGEAQGARVRLGGITMASPKFSGEGKFSRFLSDFEGFSSSQLE